MKSIHSYNKIITILVFFIPLFYASLSSGKENIEKDFKELTSKFRCMTCQNQTIYDSDAEFSIDLKNVIRQKLIDGETQQEIIEFIEKRYGEYILFEPKFDKKNIFLWSFPFIILLLSTVILIIKIKKNSASK